MDQTRAGERGKVEGKRVLSPVSSERVDEGKPMKRDELLEYLALMKSFHVGEITPVQFEGMYLALFKADQRLFPEEVFDVLNRLISDVDAFVADPEIRGQDDLDEQQLLACSREAYSRLMELFKTP